MPMATRSMSMRAPLIVVLVNVIVLSRTSLHLMTCVEDYTNTHGQHPSSNDLARDAEIEEGYFFFVRTSTSLCKEYVA